MSANLDLVRSIFSTWERGDFSSVEWADPEMEFVTADGTEPGSWAGLAELAEGMRDWLSAWKDARAGADEYRELDNERVLALVQFSGRGKTSGLELGRLSPKGAFLFNVREGKVTRIVRYLDRNRALADLGLEESPVTEESTTPDLVELDRAVEAAFRGDLEPWLSLLRPDCIWDDSAIGLGTHEGLAAIRTHVGDWIGSYEEIDNTLEERLDLGHGVMFGVSVQKGRLVGGTGYVQLRYAAVTVWVEGRIKRFTTYTDIDEARAAAERLAQERG
jgi:ketosteroid isomerase-like protein